MSSPEQVAVRVPDVCGHALLADADVVGGQVLRGTAVSVVDLVLPRTVLSADLAERGVVVLALDAAGPEERRGHLIDVVLRRAAAAHSSVVIVTGAQPPLPAATRGLAEHLGLPLLLAAPSVTSTELVVALRELVATPRLRLATLVLDAAERLGRAPATLAGVVEVLGECLPGATVYACAGPDLVLAGEPGRASLADVVGHRVPGEITGDGFGAVVLPILTPAGEVAVWLVAERERVGRLWLTGAASVLALASGTVWTWLAREQARHERDVWIRSALLTEILDLGGAVTRRVLQEAAKLGWQLDGWHTGIHLRFSPGLPTGLTLVNLAAHLERSGLGPDSLVQRTDGWSAWLTTSHEPGPDHAREVARRLERDLLPSATSERSIAVGIGSPQRDVAGLAVTLSEARQAAVIAVGANRPLSVRVLQEVGPSRLLLGWYSSEAFADYAIELLAPLLDSGEPELLRTLEAYLERACSASHTARALDVHRNTVTQRIARAERLLGASTATPDSRLALQLALRVTRARAEG